MNELDDRIATRLAVVRERMAAAAVRAGREPDEINLIAVTKTWPIDVVLSAVRVGVRHLGENRAEELAQKKEVAAEILPAADSIVWHQIGTLQSRKTALVAEYADYFHALDRLKIARRLSEQRLQFGTSLPVLVEVNLSGESTKSGFHANNWEENATQRDELRKVIESISLLQGLEIRGLMTMAPWDASEDAIRQVFRRTRHLGQWLGDVLPDVRLTELSMGMTDDFEIAIEEGATHIRVGRAIFGSRH